MISGAIYPIVPQYYEQSFALIDIPKSASFITSWHNKMFSGFISR